MGPDHADKKALIDEVGLELNELRRSAERLDEAVATLYALNRTDLRCLGILYRRGRVTAGELAEESGLTPGAITAALDRLERSGYASRVADPHDRRRVVVVSTVAAREVGARIEGEVEVAGRGLLEQRGTEELAAIRDYLRGTREVYESQAAQIAAGLSGKGGAAATEEVRGVSAPLTGDSSARLEFTKGAAKVVLKSDPAITELYRARFEGTMPDVSVQGNSITIQQRRRFRPFDWRTQSADVSLNPAVPWAISLRGGMWKLDADLRALEIQSLDVAGGASEVEIWLPEARGTVPVRISGGASRVALHRPKNVAMRAMVSGGASQLVFDGNRLGAVGGTSHFASTDFDEAVDRYEVRFSGGASQVEIDTL
ncbi:MAG: MarR family winged helix-turn-helix transcriptional regulator [Actinobacteria bacterium]|nr:MarR family winged helix-turn-helix transcriptional regulator [Actinomycetota bacterium]